VALFDGVLDVLRIVIAAANDDQILETTVDIKFAFVDRGELILLDALPKSTKARLAGRFTPVF
jgi:hypothetical protein